MSRLPKITIFATGGTIASVRSKGEAASPSLTAADLVAAVPQLTGVAEIETVQFRQLGSPQLTIADMIALSREIERVSTGDTAGAVVTQGTDTLEETSFALQLLWGGAAPVVVTGAMRNPELPGADGPANLLAAVLVAADPLARGLGALVVMNDEIHLPLFVRKTHTSNPATFRSTLTGAIGWIIENRPRIALHPLTRDHIAFRRTPDVVPPVALIRASIGDDGRMIGRVKALGYRGAVIEALGGGHAPLAMAEPLGRLAEVMPVILTSRTGAGEVLRSTYGFGGSETDLLRRGLIHGGMLDGAKAKVLLTILLAAQAGSETIGAAFEAIGLPGSRPAFRLDAP